MAPYERKTDKDADAQLAAIDAVIDAAHQGQRVEDLYEHGEAVREEFRYELLTALYVHLAHVHPETLAHDDVGACVAYILDDVEHPDYARGWPI